MTKKDTVSHPRQGLALPRMQRVYSLSSFNKELWVRLSSTIPNLAIEKSKRLNGKIAACCSWFISQQMQFEVSAKSARVVRPNSKKETSPFQKLTKSLQDAADAWKNIGEDFHDDLLSEKGNFVSFCNKLDAMADEAARRNDGLKALPKLSKIKSPRDAFIRQVADCFRNEKIATPVNGRAYDESNIPSWFQEFIVDLFNEFIGKELLRLQLGPLNIPTNTQAFYAAIAKAMAGYRKTVASGNTSPE